MISSCDIIYLDNNATTGVVPPVVEAMAPFFSRYWGNPSSLYRFGSQIRAAIDQAREQVAQLIGADPKEIVFTSCATESDNAAINSALETTGRRKIVTSSVEHSAIIKQCRRLQQRGISVAWLPVQGDGTLDLREVEKSVDEDTAICSVMWANNETGVIFPVEEIAAICRSKGVLFHTDAVQAVGRIPINLGRNQVDMLSIAGHKLHAPKGIGSLYVRRGTPFASSMIGGSQEGGRRGGTENVALIVGFGQACELAAGRLEEERNYVKVLRDKLEKTVLSAIQHSYLNGVKGGRIPNTSNISFDFVEAEAILIMLDHYGICVSSGSACTTGSLDPSHVLMAMGVPVARARGSIRFSLSTDNTESEIDKTCQVLSEVIRKLRTISPLGTSSSGK